MKKLLAGIAVVKLSQSSSIKYYFDLRLYYGNFGEHTLKKESLFENFSVNFV
jgi:hypothetical protein